jgi:hypothetical protein
MKMKLVKQVIKITFHPNTFKSQNVWVREKSCSFHPNTFPLSQELKSFHPTPYFMFKAAILVAYKRQQKSDI